MSDVRLTSEGWVLGGQRDLVLGQVDQPLHRRQARPGPAVAGMADSPIDPAPRMTTPGHPPRRATRRRLAEHLYIFYRITHQVGNPFG